MKQNFNAVMTEIFRHEGGYVNHKRDPGGETKFGISKRSYPKEDIVNLTKDRAAEIYRQDFWAKVRGDHLPNGIDLVAMDPAVNSGVSRGARWLQMALGVKTDGQIGNATVKAAQQADAFATIPRACAIRMGFLRGLKTWGSFGKGWSRRVAEVEASGMKMAASDRKVPLRDVIAKGTAQASRAATADTAKATTGAAGGSAISLTDLPIWGIAAALVLLAVVVIIAMGQRRHNLARATAYRNLKES